MLKFNKGQMLDVLLRVIEIFGWTYAGEHKFKNSSGKITKCIGFQCIQKTYYKKEDIFLLNQIIEALFYNLQIYGKDGITVYYKIV